MSSSAVSPNTTVKNRHRGSSVGDLSSLGQQTVNLSSTINKNLKHRRLKKINNEKVNNLNDLVKKLWLSYLELNFRLTWLTPLLILISTYTTFLLSNNYTPSNPLHMFIAISYPTEEIDENNGYRLYDKGPRDLAFIAFYSIFFSFFREFTMNVIVKPISERCGLKSKSVRIRFSEQMYAIVYYGISSPFGIWVMMNLPVGWFNTYYFYENYPHKTIYSWMKVYYLLQASFWFQQAIVLVLQLEKPRKDYNEFVTHHIITLCSIYASYTFNFTWIGVAIYITMDISDWFLALSKTCSYLDLIITPPVFIIFMGVWIYFRHYLNIKIMISILTEFKNVGPFRLDFKNGQYKCFISQPITFFLIFALHLLNVIWLFYIFRILFKFIIKGDAKDDREEDEEDEEDDSVVGDYEGYSTDSESEKEKKD